MSLKLLYLLILFALVPGCAPAPESIRDQPLNPLEAKGLEIFQREPCYSACHVTTLAGGSRSGFRSTGLPVGLHSFASSQCSC